MNYDTWQGRKIRNIRTQRVFTCFDIQCGCLYLSGGQIIPFDAIAGHWELVE